jgi:hypothetical protein
VASQAQQQDPRRRGQDRGAESFLGAAFPVSPGFPAVPIAAPYMWTPPQRGGHWVTQGGEAADGQPLPIVEDYLGGYLFVTDSAAEGAG